MDIRWHQIRVVQRTYTKKQDIGVPRVMAPERNMALGAAGNLLPPATQGWRFDHADFTLRALKVLVLNQRIQHES